MIFDLTDGIITASIPALIGMTLAGSLTLGLVFSIILLWRGLNPDGRSALWSAAFCALAELPLAVFLIPLISEYLKISDGVHLIDPLISAIPVSQADVLNGWLDSRHGGALLFLVYAAGLAGWLIWLGIGLSRLKRSWMVDRETGIGDCARAQDLFRRSGLSTPPPIVFSDTIRIPMIAGLWRPAIIIPKRFSRHEYADALNSILAHELSHIMRKDHWWNLFALSVTAFYWFNPLAHIARRRLIAAFEQACDDQAARLLGDARRYVSTLLDFAAASTGRSLLFQHPGMARPAGIVKRIERLINPSPSPEYALSRKTRIAAYVLLPLVAIVIATALPGRAENSRIITADASTITVQTAFTSEDSLVYPTPTEPIIPVYPKEARDAGLEDMLILTALIDENGTPQDIQVVRRQHEVFAIAALDAMRGSRWRPAVRNGTPMAYRISFPVRFNIR